MSTRSTRPGGEETEPFDAPESLVGRMLDGRYRLQETISLGGMGIVFRAEQLSTGRTVAVKVLKPTRADDPDLVRRFEREAQVLERISHPYVVSLVDAGQDAGGLHYVAMEYVDGSTFERVLEQGDLSLIEIVEVFAKTTSALAEAHAMDVIHRDLKLANIMVSGQADGHIRVTVLDFGIAKPVAEDSDMELTRKGQVPGTPGIVAPELIDEDPPTARSDLYSLGVLLFTALAGDPPFEGANDLELMRAHKHEQLPDLAELVPEYVPESLVELTEELLAKEPGGRPTDAWQVRRRLDAILRQLWELPIEGHTYVPADSERQDLESEADGGEGEESGESGDETEPADERRKGPGWMESLFGE